MDLQRHRQLVGDGKLDHALVVLDRRAEPLQGGLPQALGLQRHQVVGALER
jgi:hypothetical protein